MLYAVYCLFSGADPRKRRQATQPTSMNLRTASLKDETHPRRDLDGLDAFMEYGGAFCVVFSYEHVAARTTVLLQLPLLPAAGPTYLSTRPTFGGCWMYCSTVNMHCCVVLTELRLAARHAVS